MKRAKTGADLLKPPAPRPGGLVAVIGPAGSVDSPGRIEAAVRFLETRGFSCRVMPHALDRFGYLAAPDEGRLADLHEAFADPSISAVLCVRGGFGSLRLLDRLDYRRISLAPKPLVGYSDLTALQLALYRQIRLVTFHGPMLSNPAGDDGDLWRFENWLDFNRCAAGASPASPCEIPNSAAGDYLCLRPGLAEGPLLGGNLSMLASLCGTPYLPSLRGAIVFLEDWRESPYRIDRVLSQLRLAGSLDGIAGLVIGSLAEMAKLDTLPVPSFDDFLRYLFDWLPDIPIGYGFSLGHVCRQSTLPQGARARWDAASGRLSLLESPFAP